MALSIEVPPPPKHKYNAKPSRIDVYADGGGAGAVEVGTYEADFAYNDPKAGRVVEDVKGVLPLYILKRNLLLANYPTLIFTEVRQCRKRWKSTPITLSSLTAGT